MVDTYCTFLPGGDVNILNGQVLFDVDGDGCNVSDIPIPFIPVKLELGNEFVTTYSNENAEYVFYTGVGNFSVSPVLPNSNAYNVDPVNATVDFPNNQNNTEVQDFCLTANGTLNDVSIVVAPIEPARPGFDAKYILTYSNNGNQVLSGDIALTYDDELIDFISSNEAPISNIGGLLTWGYVDLNPFESRTINLTFNLNGPTETPPVNIDDVLDFVAHIDPIVDDAKPEDNDYTFNQVVVGAYDPNDITCVEGNVEPTISIGDPLHYVINFENTGNFAAENVVVKMTIDPEQFDISTLSLLNASHPVEMKVKNDVVEIIFEGINLEALEKGNILLRMESLETLVEFDNVNNVSDIYFDYNFPVVTNIANTVFQDIVKNTNLAEDKSVKIGPNPFSTYFNVNADSEIESVTIYDIEGRILQHRLTKSNTVDVYLVEQMDGLYIIKVITQKGASISKIVKKTE